MADRPTFTRFSSEYDGPRQYYLDDGSEVPVKPLDQNSEAYTPTYDVEVNGKPWSFNFTFDVYVDIHKRIAHFWFPFYWGGQFFMILPIVKLHKLWRKAS